MDMTTTLGIPKKKHPQAPKHSHEQRGGSMRRMVRGFQVVAMLGLGERTFYTMPS